MRPKIKVKELIDLLQSFDPELEVARPGDFEDSIWDAYIIKGGRIEYITTDEYNDRAVILK